MIKGIHPSLAEGGKIKIGGLGATRTSKAGKSWRAPEKHNYFTVTTTERNAAGDLVTDDRMMQALVASGYADDDGKVRTLPVVLHADEIDEVFPTTYALYSGKKIACRGDGESAVRWHFDRATRARLDATDEIACTCNLLTERKCKPHGTLHCSIALPGRAVAGSVHRWRTTSLVSIQQVIGSLTQIRQAIGMLRNVPLVLRVREIEVSPEGQTTRVPVVHLELRTADVMDLQQRLLDQAQRRTSLMAAMDAENQRAYRMMLQAPAGDDEPASEQAAIDAEFFAGEVPADETATPSVLEPGVHKIGHAAKKAAKRQVQKDAEKPAADVEPPHDPQAGEVKTVEVIEPDASPEQGDLGW